MRTVRYCCSLALMMLLLPMLPDGAMAGGFEHGCNGAKALGRGCAFAARADDLTALEVNPAGLGFMSGTNLFLSGNLSRLDMRFTPYLEGGGEGPAGANGTGFFPAPFLAASTDRLGHNLTVAAGVFGPSAMGASDYGKDGPWKYMDVKSEMMLAYYTAALAWVPYKCLSVGLALHWVDMINTRFTMAVNGWWEDNLKYSSESYDTYSTVDVSDRVGLAATMGLMVKPDSRWTLGASFRVPPVDIEATGDIDLVFAGEAINNAYQSGITTGEGLVPFSDSGKQVTSLPVTLKLKLPMVGRLGVRYEAPKASHGRELFDVEADLVWEGWSVLKEFTVDVGGYMMFRGPGVVEAQKIEFKKIRIKRSFADTWSVRLGGQYNPFKVMGVSLGANAETGAMPEAYTNVDFPSFNRFGIGAGLLFYLGAFELAAAYSHIWQETRDISRSESELYIQFPLSTEAPLPKHLIGAGRFESSYDVLSASVNYRF